MKCIREPRTSASSSVPPERRVVAIVGDTQVGLWVVRSLGRAGLVVYAVCATRSGLAVRSRFSNGVWTLEHPPTDSRFSSDVAELARSLRAGSVMTIAESFHIALMRDRAMFEPDVHLFCPPEAAFSRATDKDAMHALCLELGVPVAKGTTLDRLIAAEDEPLRYPLVLRARSQHSPYGEVPWKAAYARSREQLNVLYLQVERMADNILVQEYHPGVEDHVQVLMSGGRVVMTGEYEGEHHMPLAGGVTVRRTSCLHERITGDAVRLLEALGWDGVAGVQFHLDPRTGEYIFLEVNPRFIGGLPTVIMAGFDAPYLLWQSHFDPQAMRPGEYRLGLRTRILGGDANWLLGVLRGDELPPDQARPGRLAAAASFLWHTGPWTRDDVFWWRDPLPLWTDLSQMVRRLRGRSFDIIGNPETAGAGEAT